jgi:hypothetical protein
MARPFFVSTSAGIRTPVQVVVQTVVLYITQVD